jgi:hypothetical protein
MAVAAPPEREQASGLDTSPASVEGPREHAIASLKRKRKFARDSVAYVTVTGLLWLIWLITDRSTDGSIPWPAWVSLVWGFFLALDAWRAYGRWPASLNTPITEAEIDRELERTGQGRP